MASWLVLSGSGSESDGDREVLEGLRTNPGWRATAMARDGIAIIVHRSNPLQGLGLLQLQDLFGGRLHAWSDVGAESAPGQVELVSRELGSGTRAAFEVLVMADRRVSPSAVVASSSSQVVAYVAEHPFAVGYVSMAHVSSEVKVLRIEGELPTPETTGQGSYPLSREWWLVSADPPGQGVQDLIDFCLSPAGQQIVGRRLGRVR
jgi:phosphate transport system substrate-binding protein